MSKPYYSEFEVRSLSNEEVQSVADWITEDLKFALSRFRKYMALVSVKNTTQLSNLMNIHKICKLKLIEAINLGFIPRSQDSEYFEA